MQTVSVIIPFFQSESGILRRAMMSISGQQIPSGWCVEVIVVDDGSPCQAETELSYVALPEPIRLKLIRQENGGVSAARNRGLDELTPSAALVAFLDSDDTWLPNHLARAIRSHELGFDFYFTDNQRPGHHGSHVRSHCGIETGRFISASQQKSGILEIPSDYMVGLILKEFPTQASSVVYSRWIAANLRFNTTLKAAGEDMLFFTALASGSNRIGFDLDNYVECGDGLNMYFGHLDWDSPRFLAIQVDKLIAHRLIQKTLTLSLSNHAWNKEYIRTLRLNCAFHILRLLAKYPRQVPKAITRLLRRDPALVLLLPVDMILASRRALRARSQIQRS